MRPSLPGLTSSRFFAALFVLVYHFHLTRTDIPNISAFSFGYPAVTFFFVLSGFILTYTHLSLGGINVSLAEFSASRVSRLAPAYYLALAISLPVFFIKGPFASAPFVLSMTQAWIPAYALAWNSPAWSLSNEMFFYLCFPAILIWTRRFPDRTLLAVAFIIVLVTALGREQIFKSDNWGAFRPYFPLFNLPQFVLGMALGKYYVALDRRPGIMCFPIGVALLATVIAFRITNTAILSCVFAVIIFGACRPMLIMSAKPLMIVGEASYSIYILHAPILSYWTHVRPRQMPWEVDLGLFLSIVTAISIAAHYLFEQPVRKWIRSALAGRNGKTETAV
jgi:peptidoglycan/LPS O-acetylase OafA/YrhL